MHRIHLQLAELEQVLRLEAFIILKISILVLNFNNFFLNDDYVRITSE